MERLKAARRARVSGQQGDLAFEPAQAPALPIAPSPVHAHAAARETEHRPSWMRTGVLGVLGGLEIAWPIGGERQRLGLLFVCRPGLIQPFQRWCQALWDHGWNEGYRLGNALMDVRRGVTTEPFRDAADLLAGAEREGWLTRSGAPCPTPTRKAEGLREPVDFGFHPVYASSTLRYFVRESLDL